jgi:hypothetical protein
VNRRSVVRSGSRCDRQAVGPGRVPRRVRLTILQATHYALDIYLSIAVSPASCRPHSPHRPGILAGGEINTCDPLQAFQRWTAPSPLPWDDGNGSRAVSRAGITACLAPMRPLQRHAATRVYGCSGDRHPLPWCVSVGRSVLRDQHLKYTHVLGAEIECSRYRGIHIDSRISDADGSKFYSLLG